MMTLSSTHSSHLHFPFLRDHLFISYFKSLKPTCLESFEAFVLNAQLDYYIQFIDKNYNPTQQSLAVSKCPFASKLSTKSFAVEPLSKVRYTLLQNIHISDMNLSDLTVNLVRSGEEVAADSEIKLFLSGPHTISHNNTIPLICLSDSRFEMKSFEVDRFSYDLTEAIIKAKSNHLTASDLHYLFPSSTLIIKPESLDKFLNLVVYLKIAGFSLTFDNLRTAAGRLLAVEPSTIEPYEDILTIEYLQAHPNLFS